MGAATRDMHYLFIVCGAPAAVGRTWLAGVLPLRKAGAAASIAECNWMRHPSCRACVSVNHHGPAPPASRVPGRAIPRIHPQARKSRPPATGRWRRPGAADAG